MKRGEQISFQIRPHGGFREGSGRKKILADELPHSPRERVNARTPLHLNFKLIAQAPCLRTPKLMRELPTIIANARRRGLRIQHYTIESNHIHLICEADNNEQVKCGMISLKSSIAWALRRIFMFHGKVFEGRYYAHLLKTPTEMRNALRYVLFNRAHHANVAFFADEFSSIFGFDDPYAFANIRFDKRPSWFAEIWCELSKAESWMQSQGWRRGRK